MKNINEIHLTEIIRFLKNQPIETLPQDVCVEIEKLIDISQRLVCSEKIDRLSITDYDKFQMLCYSILLLWNYIPHGEISFAFKRQNGNSISKERLECCQNNRKELVDTFIRDCYEEYPETPISRQTYDSKISGVKFLEDKICGGCPFFERTEEYRDYYWHLRNTPRYAEYFKDNEVYHTGFRCLKNISLDLDGSYSPVEIGDIKDCPRCNSKDFKYLFLNPYKCARKEYRKQRQIPLLFVQRIESKWDDFFYKMSDELFDYIYYFVSSYYRKLKMLDIAKEATSRLILEEYLEFDKPFKKYFIKYAKL